MATIEERKQQLENKLKKMAEDNVVVKPVTIPNSFDPSEDTESSPATSGEEDNNLEETKETKTAKEKPVDEIEREETGNTEQKRERKPIFSRWFHVWHTPRLSRRLEFRCPTPG